MSKAIAFPDSMKPLIKTLVILAAIYSTASQADDINKHQTNLINSFQTVVETVKRASALAKEEFPLISERFKNERFVQNLESNLNLSDVLIPGPPKEGTSYKADMFLAEVRMQNVELATNDIISYLSLIGSLNGILLTEASLDPDRENTLRDLYDEQSKDLFILSQEFNAWIVAHRD
jgi:hypothetical protein